MVDHDPGGHHPERPERLTAIREALEERAVPGASWRSVRPAERAWIERVHPAEHIDLLETARGKRCVVDGDTRTSEATVEAAWLAAGAAVEAVEEVVRGEADNAFALVRPPGHHAEAARAMGFCFFNNIAIAAAHARAELGCERILVVDWDVHHGNGTQSTFFDRRDVLFFSAHRYPFFPGSGAAPEVGTGEGEGFTINLPLPPTLGDGDYETLFDALLRPIAEEYRPDLVLVSAGFDAHADDPLGDQEVGDEGFAGMCGVVRDIAEAYAGGRLVLLLEGGYDLHGLAESARACTQILTGETPPARKAPGDLGERVRKAATGAFRRYWKLPAATF